METSTEWYCRMCVSIHALLTAGTRTQASADALMMKSLTDSFCFVPLRSVSVVLSRPRTLQQKSRLLEYAHKLRLASPKYLVHANLYGKTVVRHSLLAV